MRFIVAVLFSIFVVRSSHAQQAMPATDMARWLDYQEKLNQSRVEMELRSPMRYPGIPAEAAISVARLRHTPPGKALKAFQRGLKLDKAGDAVGSAEAFREAVAVDPAYPEAHTDLGVEYMNLGLLDDAAAEFRSAIALDPSTGVHHANLGLALIVLGRLREAEPEARTAVALDGTNAKAHYLLGYILAQRQETRPASEEHLEYAARELPEARSALGELCCSTGCEAELRERLRDGKQARTR